MAADMATAQQLCANETGQERARCILFYVSDNPLEDYLAMMKHQESLGDLQAPKGEKPGLFSGLIGK